MVGIAQRLGTKIYAEPRKRAYIDEQTDDPGLTALMTLEHKEVCFKRPLESRIALSSFLAYLCLSLLHHSPKCISFHYETSRSKG